MYGLPFPPAPVRLAQLDEAIRVCKLLWTEERADFAGEYFTLAGAVCEPKPIQRPGPPIWIGGMGERRTLRVVAEQADGWNAFPLPVPHLRQKLDALRGHCAAMGRDYDAIRKQLVCTAIVRADPARVEEELARFAGERQAPPERARQMAIAGTPEEVAARLAPYVDLGFDMFLLLERAPLDYETLRLFMAEVAPRLRAAAGQGGVRGMAQRLTSAQRRWLLALHLFFVAVWLGTTVALLWLTIAAAAMPGFDRGTVAGLLFSLLDRPVRVSAVGTTATGLLLSLLTHWGVFKHWWLIAKEAVAVLALGFSLAGVRVATAGAFAGDVPDVAPLLAGIGAQIVALALAPVVSVFKPWGRRGGAGRGGAARREGAAAGVR